MTGISEPAVSPVFCMKRKSQVLLSPLSGACAQALSMLVLEVPSQCDWNPLLASLKFFKGFSTNTFFATFRINTLIFPWLGLFWQTFFFLTLPSGFFYSWSQLCKRVEGKETQKDILGCQLQCCVGFPTLCFLFFLIQPVFLPESEGQDNWSVPALLLRSSGSAVVVKDIDGLENGF